jgi:hypothetical protein
MIFAANLLLLLAFSLFPGKDGAHDPHGFRSLAEDTKLRRMLTEGRLEELDAAVEGFVSSRLKIDLQLKAQPSLTGDSSLASLLGLIQDAVRISAFAAELKALGPVLGLREAVRWVESGLIRHSGVKRARFPSLFAIIAEPGHSGIRPEAMRALARDQAGAILSMDRAYEQIAGALVSRLP